jgi:peptide/nickel transport system substrate-binding protein
MNSAKKATNQRRTLHFSSKKRAAISPSRCPLLLVSAPIFLAIALISGCSSSSPASARTAGTAATNNFAPPFDGHAVGDISNLVWDLPYGEPLTLYPPNAADYSSAMAVSNLCDPLMRRNPNGSIGPNIATSWSQPNPLTVVFTIRTDIRFWDGDPLTTADVVYSMDQDLNPDSIMSFYYANVNSVRASGASTVTVKFSKPNALFLQEMESIPGMIFEKKYSEAEGKNIGTAQGGIMCSGPFKLVKWSSGNDIQLARNNNYWNPAYRAHAASVTLDFITDSSAISAALTSDEIDGAFDLPPAILPRLESSSTGNALLGEPQQYLTLSVANPSGPLKNIDLRHALFASIDRPALAKEVFDDSATANYTLLQSGAWGWDPAGPQVKSLWQAAYPPFVKANTISTSAAKKLVKESGYRGQTIPLAIPSGNATFTETAELIEQNAQSIGVNVSIDSLQSLQYSNALSYANYRSGIGLILQAAYIFSGSPLELVPFEVVGGQTYNYTNYNNPTVDRLLSEAEQTFDAAEQTKLLIEAQAIYEQAYTATNLLNLDEITYLNKNLSGIATTFNYISEPSLATIGSAK